MRRSGQSRLLEFVGMVGALATAIIAFAGILRSSEIWINFAVFVAIGAVVAFLVSRLFDGDRTNKGDAPKAKPEQPKSASGVHTPRDFSA